MLVHGVKRAQYGPRKASEQQGRDPHPQGVGERFGHDGRHGTAIEQRVPEIQMERSLDPMDVLQMYGIAQPVLFAEARHGFRPDVWIGLEGREEVAWDQGNQEKSTSPR